MTLPASIGRYQIVREIGRGAMGIVYEGRDAALLRPAAIKVLAVSVPDPERERLEQRFLQEARAAAILQHPGIVVVYEVGVDPASASHYMALEYLRGETLEKVLSTRGRLAWQEALGLGRRLAEALHHAHAHGIVHRDMKPANVMVLPSGEPKIMDFGVAKLEASQLTTQGQVLGSPSYMAPEQAVEARADARSDVFSLGSILYEAITGQRAFPGRNVTEIVLKLAQHEPEPPSRLAPGLPPAVDALIASALAKDPERRCPSAQAFSQAVAAALESRESPPASGTLIAPAGGDRTQASGGSGLHLPPGKRVSLAFVSGPRAGEVFRLDRPTLLIGRQGAGGGAGLELADPQVSRAHATLECRGSRVVLRDLQSSNGTLVDGQRIEERELEDRAEFQVGASRIVLVVTDAD